MDVGRRKATTTLDLFWSKVDIRGPDECWLWLAYKDKDGYGGFQSRPAHRVAYELANGPILPGLTIDHLCRVHACVNPRHLEAVTIQVNIGRGSRATQTHCKYGHPLDGVQRNNSVRKGTSRYCKTCDRKRKRGVPRWM